MIINDAIHKDAYNRGVHAARHGEPEWTNPYPVPAQKEASEAWTKGWRWAANNNAWCNPTMLA